MYYFFFVDDPGKKVAYQDRRPERPEARTARSEGYVSVPIEEPSNPAPEVGQNMSDEDKGQAVAFDVRTERLSIDQLEKWDIDSQGEEVTKKQK